VGRFTENPTVIVAGDLVVGPSEDRRTLTASEIDGSGTRWQLFFPDQSVVSIDPAGMAVIVTLFVMDNGPPARPGIQSFSSTVLALDARTGGRLWQRDAAPLASVDATGVLVLQMGGGGTGVPIVGTEPATGREVWRRTVPVGGQAIVVERAAASPPEQLLIVPAEGTARAVRIADGVSGEPERTSGSGPVVFAWEDLVVRQVEHTDAASEIAVYRRGKNLPLWSRKFPSSEFRLFRHGCGSDRRDVGLMLLRGKDVWRHAARMRGAHGGES